MKAPALAPLDPADIVQSLVAFVNTNIMAPARAIGADHDLKSVGVDSMSMLKILVFVEAKFGFWVPAEDLAENNLATLRALANYVAEHGNEAC
jgi:acyl carrier protein